ncbi:exonuclease SbcCD subunit D [Longivirga aurantiaca]|uniref:Nuclease SbcCD subunit D n=1 Tax=Longivirga aurantiaca TaxID=1837743 RepID=A0ABW1T071_9ACTN
MRLLHTSDWHLGRTLFQTSLHTAHEAFLAWLLETAVEQQVDAVLVSGDVYDRAVPPLDSVQLLDRTFLAFAEAGVPLVVVSGNHDSAVRLGFGSGLAEASRIHLRTTIAGLAEPVVLTDEHGDVAVYGIPYLLPDSAKDALGVERSHEAVLGEATRRILADAAQRGIARTVVLAHAFVTGGTVTESERDLRVGGIGDSPAHVFDGVSYVALGHLHRPQQVSLGGSSTVLRYSGSPIAFSFSEKDDTKSVTLVEIDADGAVITSTLAAPVPRPLREVRGRLDDLVARAGTDLADLAEAWVKVVLTDPSRPAAPMERLREHWPHTLVLDFAPDGSAVSEETDLARLRRTTDPVEVCTLFVEYVDRVPPTDEEALLLRDAVEAVRHAEVSR